MRARLRGAAPPVLVCSAFEMTETETIGRGAERFLAKPVSASALLEAVEEILAGRALRPCKRETEQRRVAEERTRSRAAAQERLAAVSRTAAATFASPWLDWTRTYFGFSWAGLYFLDGDDLRLLCATGLPAGDVLEHQALREAVAEVVETRTSLAIADSRAHPSFHAEPLDGPPVRAFIGVPLVASGNIAVGALCLADTMDQRCDAESLLILEQLGRRGSVLVAGDDALDTSALSERTAPLLAGDTFSDLLEMELRLAGRRGESVELALIELERDASSVECAQRLWAVSAGARVATGSLGPLRVGLCQRGKAAEVERRVASALEVVRKRCVVAGVGVVSVNGDVGLSQTALLHLAEQAVLTSRDKSASRESARIVVGRGGA
jgi:GAF domain-containing protein